jgi:transcriptional regulator with XRE-family HTH domain
MEGHDPWWHSRRVHTLVAAGDIGALVRLARQARGWRQAELGAAAGYGASAISRLETSNTGAANVLMVKRVAAAVGIPLTVVSEALGVASSAPATVGPRSSPTGGPPEREDPMRRRALVAAGLMIPVRQVVALDDTLASLPTLHPDASGHDAAARLAQARRLFDAGQHARLLCGLPDLLIASHARLARESSPAGHALLAASYSLATEFLAKVHHLDASRITADRARLYAHLTESATVIAGAARVHSIVLRHDGRTDLAERITLDAALAVEATGLTSRAELATYAQMLCTAAYSTAQAGDREHALELIRDAERAASRIPTGPNRGQPEAITPAAVALYRVGVHWSLGDAGAALHAGRNLRPGQFATPERRGRLHTDMARAWWQWGKPEPAAHALLAACQHAPGEVRDRPAIRAIATTLIRQHPTVSGVPALAAALHHTKATNQRPHNA